MKHKISYGNDYQYAATRIVDTVVMYNGEPVYVYTVDAHDGMCRIAPLKGGLKQSVHVDKLDVIPPKLGFYNQGINSYFVGRRPTRHYKQGLNSVNTYASSIRGGFAPHIDWISNNMYNCVMGIYPKAIDCLEAIMVEEAQSRAFSREFALSKKIGHNMSALYFRKHHVGYAKPTPDASDVVITFDKKYEFLQEMFEETVNVQ